MTVLDALLNSLPAEPAPILSVVVGLHLTMVCSRTCGLASSLCDAGPHGHDVVREVGTLHQKSAQQLAQWVRSKHLLEASLGMAALNSMLEPDFPISPLPDAVDFLSGLVKGRNLCAVGRFAFLERLRPLARHLWIIERHLQPGELPESAAPTYLPWADVILMTSSALINHTFDALIAHRPRHGKVIVMGASTPFSRQMFAHGVDYLSGPLVEDTQAATFFIQQGSTFTTTNGIRLVLAARKGLTL